MTNKKRTTSDIAILELSSRACKFMTVRTATLRNGFDWSAFRSESTLTQIGQLLDQNNKIRWHDFEEKILPTIQKYTSKARNNKDISKLYCVATAAYRQADNQQEILDKLKETLQLEVILLTQEEEAELTLEAFRWSSPPRNGNMLLVDQGGCSTEISIFSQESSKIEHSDLPFGTTSLIQLFFQGVDAQSSLSSALELFLIQEQKLLHRLFANLQRNQYKYMVGVGSAITKVTKQRRNKQQHGMILSQKKLQETRKRAKTLLSVNFKTVANLQYYLIKNKIEKDSLEEEIVIFFGLGLFIELLSTLNLDDIIVNGAGLRYGVCLRELQKTHPHLKF